MSFFSGFTDMFRRRSNPERLKSSLSNITPTSEVKSESVEKEEITQSEHDLNKPFDNEFFESASKERARGDTNEEKEKQAALNKTRTELQNLENAAADDKDRDMAA